MTETFHGSSQPDVPARRGRWWRWRWWRRGLALAGFGGLWGLLHSTGYGASLGGTPTAERLARMQSSPQFQDGRFTNPVAFSWDIAPGEAMAMFRQWLWGEEQRRPTAALPITPRTQASFAPAPASGLQVTWLGHSTLLVEIDGRRILTDPVFSERASPSSVIGPARFHQPPLAIAELPQLDAVVVSHDHYDHLDKGSIRALNARGERFVVPLGVGAHLEAWGVPANRITELDWWEETALADSEVRVVATPAQHSSGRGLRDQNCTLWASWAFIGPTHRAYFSGDTGMFPGFAEIGARLGPFDITMIEVGAYDPRWGFMHLGPERALEAHRALRGKALLPVHWGTFNLAFHGWTWPAEQLWAMDKGDDRIAFPRPGETVTAGQPTPANPWWRTTAPAASGPHLAANPAGPPVSQPAAPSVSPLTAPSAAPLAAPR